MSCGNEVIALGTQELRGPNESEARKRVEQRQLGAWLGQHEISKIMWLSTQLGGMNSTLQPTASTRETRLGSMIFTSDSPAKNVVSRILLSEVFATT
jgi:hypothetical protein